MQSMTDEYRIPRLDEVLAFAEERHIEEQTARSFYAYYEREHWMTKTGNPVRGWKGAMICWCRRHDDRFRAGYKSMNKWKSAAEERPEVPCLIIDDCGNYPRVCHGMLTLATEDGKKRYIDSNSLEEPFEGLRGKMIELYGVTEHTMPYEIVYWCAIPGGFMDLMEAKLDEEIGKP